MALASRAFVSQEVLWPRGGGAGVVDGRVLFVVSMGKRIDLRNGDGAGKVGNCETLLFDGLCWCSESFRGTIIVSRSGLVSDTGRIDSDVMKESLGRVTGRVAGGLEAR